MKKLSKVTLTLVLALAAFTGAVGTHSVAADSAATAQPCCKTGS